MADKIKVRGRDVGLSSDETVFKVKGIKGDRGAPGPRGLPGKDGLDGRDGIDGLNGKDGLNGSNGKDGLNGVNGKDGLNGTPGAPGRDGVSVKQAAIKDNGHLYLTLSDGREIDAGRARGEDGKKGKSYGGAAYQIAYDAETRVLSLEMGNGVTLPIFTEDAAGLVPPPGTATGLFLRDDGAWATAGGGGASDWGDIGGTLSDQTDLQAALDGKAPLSHTHATNWGPIMAARQGLTRF